MLPFDDRGTDGPPVVLIHAGIADRSMWAETAEALAGGGVRSIAVDLPGFGDAAPPAGAVDEPWNDVLATLDALEIDRFVAVGCSYGAAVALRVAARAPERIAGLLLCATPLADVEISEELASVWDAEETALAAGDIGAAVDLTVNAWLLPGAPAELRARVAEMQRRAYLVQRSAPQVPEGPDPLAEHPAALERIDAPVAVLVGEHDRREFRDAAALLAGRLPGARTTTIPGAGHLPPLETPEAFLAAVRGLLARVDV